MNTKDTNFEDDDDDVTEMMVVVMTMMMMMMVVVVVVLVVVVSMMMKIMMVMIIIFSQIPGCRIQFLNNGNSKYHYWAGHWLSSQPSLKYLTSST